MLKKSLGLASIFLMPIAMYLIFFYASTEKTMGIVQKIFYFHVPNALLSYTSAILLGFASIMYLIKADRAWDRFGSVAGELGAVFTSTAIVSGMIWGKPAWGKYWVSWDVRLNLELILLLTFIAYLMLRAYLPNEEKRATLSCVFGLLAVLNIPFNWLSIYFLPTQHPQPVVSPGGGGLEPDMWVAFNVSFIAWFVLYSYLFVTRLEVAKLQEEVDYLEHKVRMA
jgi:heme exporter protein C